MEKKELLFLIDEQNYVISAKMFFNSKFYIAPPRH